MRQHSQLGTHDVRRLMTSLAAQGGGLILIASIVVARCCLVRWRACGGPGTELPAVTQSACGASTQAPHLSQPFRVRGEAVEIGEPERTYTVEPLEDPVPRESPAEPAESPTGPSPTEEPSEPERLPTP
jgi:hypothetical protein